MKNGMLTVFIPASGTGSGLGETIKYRNKTLIRVGLKPVISHIIDSYPQDTHFIISLGHFAKQVKDFLLLAYPEKSFTLVQVDKYEGKGSSLGYSMLKASPYLQTPFILHTSDTIVREKIPTPISNWVGGYNGEGSSHYTSFNVLNGKIQKIMEKGIVNPDYLHIGLFGIADYKKFWKYAKKLYKENTFGDSLGDVHVLNALFAENVDFKIKEFKTWLDIGNIDSLKYAEKQLSGSFYNLDKAKESIFFVKNRVIKYFSDELKVKKLIRRGEILKGVVPRTSESKGNFLIYTYVKGSLFADIVDPTSFKTFLNWSKDSFWKPTKEVDQSEFKKACFDMYYTKTKQRIDEFLSLRNINDYSQIINGENIPSVKRMFREINFDKLSNANQTFFHGDYILDNIIKTSKGYSLLDWRDDFGGLSKAGDMYYDLAKLNHNLTINHSIVHKNLFSVSVNGKNVEIDIFRKENLVQCQRVLHNFIRNNGYDLKKVKILTALIWFSSSPLHHHPYDNFLFYFGKINLWRALNEGE